MRAGGTTDLAVDAAIAGTGIVYLFEDWLRLHLDGGALEPVLEPWWMRFSGPFLYYPGRHLVPAPLRTFIDFLKASSRHHLRAVDVQPSHRPKPCSGATRRSDFLSVNCHAGRFDAQA